MRCVYNPATDAFHQIHEGEAFTSYQRKILTEAEAAQYGAQIGEVISQQATSLSSWAGSYGAEDFERHCIRDVVEVEKPEGKVVVAGPTDPGYGIEAVDGVPTQVWQVRDYTADELVALKAARRHMVKQEARRRIVAAYPEWKQLNLTKRAVEILRLKQAGSLTQEQEAEEAELVAAAAWVDAIRAASGQIEALLPDDPIDLAGFNVVGHQLWPSAQPPGVR